MLTLTIICNHCSTVIYRATTRDRKIIYAEKLPLYCSVCDHHCGQTTDPYPFEVRAKISDQPAQTDASGP